MKSLFTQVKTQVTARQAAERYGVFVNRSGMARCIFHDDFYPLEKLDRAIKEELTQIGKTKGKWMN